MNLRFPLEHVQARGPDGAGAERRSQGPLVDDRPAGGVDEHRGRFHPPEPFSVDQAGGALGQRQVDGDEVGGPEQRVEIGPANAEFLFEVGSAPFVPIEDFHAEPEPGTASDRLADATHAEDAERTSVDLLAAQEHRSPALVPPGSQETLGLREPPCRRQQQRHRQVGGGAVEHSRRVGDPDSAHGRLVDVHVVESDRHVRHHAQIRRPIEELHVHALREQRQDHVRVRSGVEQQPTVHRCVLLEHRRVHARLGTQPCYRLFRNRSGHQQLHRSISHSCATSNRLGSNRCASISNTFACTLRSNTCRDSSSSRKTHAE